LDGAGESSAVVDTAGANPGKSGEDDDMIR
jgi:hypothetical protein